MKKFSILILSISAFSFLYANDINLKSCAACHGQNFEKSALNKSKIVKDMTNKDIRTALKGYKEGSYGGTMKGVMKGQVVRYSDKELEEIADTIKPLEVEGE